MKHSNYAISLNNLALLYDKQGLFTQAEPLYERATEIFKDTLGNKHPTYARCLSNLATLYILKTEYSRAEPLLKQALQIKKETWGEKNPQYAYSLINLGLLHRKQDQYAEAERYLKEGSAILKDALGVKHPSYVTSLRHLAILSHHQGRYDEAISLLDKVLAITGEIHSSKHPDYCETLHLLAILHSKRGQYALAETFALQAIRAIRELLQETSIAQAEQQQRAYSQYLRDYLDNLCIITAHRKELDVSRVYAEILAWKGAITARQRHTRLVRTLLENKPDTETTKLLKNLDAVSRQLASLAITPPTPDKSIDIPQRMRDLSNQREQLEKDLSLKTESFRRWRETQKLTLVELQKQLPQDGVLIDFFEYRVDFGREANSNLAAFVVTAKSIARVELGKSEPLAEAIRLFRAQLKQASPTQGKDDAGLLLREKLWTPLEKHITEAKLLLISPDGSLNGLPFAALPTGVGEKLLIEKYSLAVLPVPQLLSELLTSEESQPSTASALLVGGVSFDVEVNNLAAAGSSWAVRAGKLKQWQGLPGTTKEVESLGKLFAQNYPTGRSTLLQSTQASEDTVRRELSRHRWIHLATHGFFTAPEISALRLAGDSTAEKKLVGHDPRLLSGIVLAGANRQPMLGQDDGILTALEVGELDLTRVELAVLSACETGLGTVAGGEGVLGLQRAFQVAGAKSVITTLWQIPDEPTRILMERFYENLWKGRDGKKFSKLEALREAQLWMLKDGKAHPGIARGLVRDDVPPPTKDGRLPPYYWAAFVLSGDWR